MAQSGKKSTTNDTYVIGLDLSTTCTGWALFRRKDKKLIDYGFIKPSKRGLSEFKYPIKQLFIMQQMSSEIAAMLREHSKTLKIEKIVIEEVNRGIARLGQKVLSGFHFILLTYIAAYNNKIVYKDSDGKTGWRTNLGLRLTDEDKRKNKQNRALNKELERGSKLPTINKKHLACRFVNEKFNKEFDVDRNTTDNDVVDAIAMTYAYLTYF